MSDKKEVAFVLVEDNGFFANILKGYFDSEVIDCYSHPKDFMAHVADYSLDTKIILDNVFPSTLTGIDLAKMLHEKGYKKLYLLTGDVLKWEDIPDYITVILKSDPDAVKKI